MGRADLHSVFIMDPPPPWNILLNYFVNDAKKFAKYQITVHVYTISLDRLVRDLIETSGTILRNT